MTSLLTVAGLVLTAVGALIAARAVIISENDVGEIAVTRVASDNPRDWSNSPLAQSLLKASKGAQRGLYLILSGTVLQILAAALAGFGVG